MQIFISFHCRECNKPNSLVWDTAGWVVKGYQKKDAGVIQDSAPLACEYCAHISGELKPQYIYRAEHRPSWEQSSS
jgi:hypothetical protein